MKYSIFLLAVLGMMLGCNPNVKYSKILSGSTWRITSAKVDGVAVEINGTNLRFEECSIYEELCMATWSPSAGGVGKFIWQFRERAKTLELVNQTESSEPLDVAAGEACLMFSAVYAVEEKSKTRIELNGKNDQNEPIKLVIEK